MLIKLQKLLTQIFFRSMIINVYFSKFHLPNFADVDIIMVYIGPTSNTSYAICMMSEIECGIQQYNN